MEAGKNTGRSALRFALVGTLVFFSMQQQSLAQANEQDSLALVELYNATDGENWTKNDNWLSEDVPLDDWYGVNLWPSGRVAQVILNNNNLSGVVTASIGNVDSLIHMYLNDNNLVSQLPATLGDMPTLRWAFLQNNQLEGDVPFSSNNLQLLTIEIQGNNFSGLPDLSGITTLNKLWAQNNAFTFEDLEPNALLPISNLIYKPQDSVLTEETHVLNWGDDLLMDATIGGQNNQYQWVKDGQEIAGANQPTYEIINADGNLDAGIYTCRITNPLVPQLTLFREVITVEIQGSNALVPGDSLALIAIYNETGGADWIENTNWLDPDQPVDSWYGVSVQGVRVEKLELPNNGLVGQLPDELGDLSGMQRLDVSNNNLTGTLPTTIGQLTDLRSAFFANNDFSGAVPEEALGLSAIDSLSLRDNDWDQLPDLSSLEPFTFFIQRNKFTFEDVVPHVGGSIMLAYAPQDSVFETESKMVAPGGSVTLESSLPCNDGPCPNLFNQYSWYKDGVLVQSGSDGDFSISNAQMSDEGQYSCDITNPLAPDLTLHRRIITLEVDAVTALEEDGNQEASLFDIYPNPAGETVRIQLSKTAQGTIEIYDGYGKHLASNAVEQTNMELSLIELPAGVYFVLLRDFSGKVSAKRTLIHN